jgi:hypothetical protein
VGTLNDKFYIKNPHSLEELKENFRRGIANISRKDICNMPISVFRKCDVCLEAGGQYFETVLWNKII